MKKLTKSRDKWLCGIIGGLAEYFGVGSPLLLYVLLYFIMPEAD